jgi:predicted nucleotidyltransferase
LLSIDEMAAKVAHWASKKPGIGEVWFYGSRVGGNHREDSDLDIAIVVARPELPREQRDRIFTLNQADWEDELKDLLRPVRVDLDQGDADISTRIVAPALKNGPSRQAYPMESET